MTLVEFLTARLDEDEAAATRHLDDASGAGWGDYPARVLREVAAKRAILAEHSPTSYPYDDEVGDESCTGCGLGGDEEYRETINTCPTLRALASVYSDHPDYREEWRP